MFCAPSEGREGEDIPLLQPCLGLMEEEEDKGRRYIQLRVENPVHGCGVGLQKLRGMRVLTRMPSHNSKSAVSSPLDLKWQLPGRLVNTSCGPPSPEGLWRERQRPWRNLWAINLLAPGSLCQGIRDSFAIVFPGKLV